MTILVVGLLAAASALVLIVTSYRSSPPASTSFQSADKLVGYLAAHELPCGPVKHVSEPINAQSLIDCGDTIVVAVYSRHEDALHQFDSQAATLKGLMALHMAIGSNWTVSSDEPAYAQAVAKLLKAEYKTT